MLDTIKILKFTLFAFSLTGMFLKANCQGDIYTDMACMQLVTDDDENDEYELQLDGLHFSICNNGRHHFLHITLLRIGNGCEPNNTCFGQMNNGYMNLLQQVEGQIIGCIREDDAECDIPMDIPVTCPGNNLFMEYNYTCPGMSTAATEVTTQRNLDDKETTHEPAITDKVSGPSEDMDDEDSSLSQGGKIAIAVLACAVALLLLIILTVCLVRRNTQRHKSKSSPCPDLEGAVNAASEQSTAYTSHIPGHVHFIPYDLLINPRHASQYEEIPDNQVTEKPQPSVSPAGECAEIDGDSSGGYAALRTSQMTEDQTMMTENGAPKKDVSYAVPNKLINNVAYQSLDEYPRDNYDNAGHSNLKRSSESEDLSRQHSVQRMVVNDIYNQ